MDAILRALGATLLGVVAFAAAHKAGASGEASLIAAMILAGLANIGWAASLNAGLMLPTSMRPVGEP